MKYWIAFLVVLGISAPAQADWQEGQSEHFIIYANDSPRDVAKFAEMLERYHTAMSLLTGREIATPSPSNRVTIFAVGSTQKVSKLAGDRNAAGFYIPRAGGSRAFVPNIRVSNGEPDFSLIVLMHEYAHHFLIGTSRHAMPRWMSEGAAEFFASAKFPSDGSVQIGRPAYHRAGELTYAQDVSVEELLDPEVYEEKHGRRYDAFYGRSWLLYHYLNFDEGRKDQLTAYWREISEGTPERAAAEKVFGDLDKLEKELNAYQRRRSMFNYNLKPEMVPTGPITVRAVSEGFAEALPLVIRSQRGVNREEALELLPEVREVAREYPEDARVLAALAEAEHDAGNDQESIAAADRAIAIDPTVKNAYIQKGYSLFRMAADAEDSDAAYNAAMEPFSALNAMEHDHPLPLVFYYRSYAERGVEPPENAKHAMERAAELAPFDHNLAMEAALMDLQDGHISAARYLLEPVAANPHGGGRAELARSLTAAIAEAAEGEPFDPSPVMALAALHDEVEGAAEPGGE